MCNHVKVCLIYLFLPLFFSVTLFSGCESTRSEGGLTPEMAINSFEIPEEFTLTLVAAEPQIADPVAMEIDEHGQAYIVEMPGYPLDLSKSGKVKLFRDTNGDGVWDKRTVFAEGLTLPTGIMRWKKGVIVTDAPDVLYLEDTDQDGKADVKEVLLTGFALSNPQHNMNTPVYGLDNWIYLANEYYITTKAFDNILGDKGTEIHFPGQPDSPRLPPNADDRNVRFRPDTYELELLSGRSQHGHTFDTWGHHFMTSNADHLYHEVIAAPYLLRNPVLLVADAAQYIPAYERPAEVFPITQHPEHQLLTDVGVVTSACGITCYLGGAFPNEYNQAIFVGEPVHNLVHIDRLVNKGATFEAHRILKEKEFLASTDSWFRPVNFYIGPNGEMYVVDYYRKIIEHPEWMADEVNQSGQLYHGTNQGRIYKITAKNSTPSQPAWSLAENPTVAELVAALAHDNIWWRRTAQRLLVDQKPDEATSLLEQMARSNPSATARLHALWTLEGMHKLSSEMVKLALQDAHAGVRENAIRMAELHLDTVSDLASDLIQLRNDPDPKVRFQLLCTLGALSSREATLARQELLVKDIEDEWVHLAALSATQTDFSNLFAFARNQTGKQETEGKKAFFHRLGGLMGLTAEPAAISSLIQTLTNPAYFEQDWWQAATMDGLAEGLQHRDSEGPDWEKEKIPLLRAFTSGPGRIRQSVLTMLEVAKLSENQYPKPFIQTAMEWSEDASVSPEKRAHGFQVLGLANPASHFEVFRKTLRPQEPAIVQKAVLKAMNKTPGIQACDALLKDWSGLTPDLRREAVNVFMSSPERMASLLNAVEAGTVDPAHIGWRRTVRLLNNGHLPTRNKAREVLAPKENDRNKIIAQYASALDLTGDGTKGKQVFSQACATCHQMQGQEGIAYGPDLASVRNRTSRALMTDILDPQRSIADGYELWQVKTNQGEDAQGIIATETPTSITLRQADGSTRILARKDITSLKAVDISAMPAGLEAQISPEQMADLLAFLKGR